MMAMKRENFNLFHLVPCVLVLFIFINTSFSQITWQRTYGGIDFELGYCVDQTADNGYIGVGISNSFGNYIQVYLVKTDSLGDTLWTRTYGGSGGDYGYSVCQTTDGGYIITGSTSSFGNGNQIYLIKTDSIGDTLWTKTYGGPGSEMGYSLQQTTDGGYIIVGYTNSFGNGAQVYLLKTDSLGDTLWTKIYGSPGHDKGFSVQQTRDGGYIIGGYWNSPVDKDPVCLIKTDSLGDTLWVKTYGSDWCFGYSAKETFDGGYVIVGVHSNAYVVKTDSIGDTLWTRVYRWKDGARGYFVQQTQDSCYIIAGWAMELVQYEEHYYCYLLKIDSNGDTLWSKVYGMGMSDDGFRCVNQTNDGGYIAVGATAAFGDNYQLYLVKTDQDGNVAGIEERGCAQRLSTQPRLLVYSNPFSGKTTIKFQILNPKSEVNSKSQTSLKIYDAQGRLVRQWGYKTIRQSDKITWDGTDDSGNLLSPGVYFCRLETNESAVTTKVIKLE